MAIAEAASGAEVRLYGTIANAADSVWTLCRKLSRDGMRLHFCFEARPCGSGVYRLLTRLGHRCEMVPPALIPRILGERVKTDRHDPMILAQALPAGQLTAEWLPDKAHERHA